MFQVSSGAKIASFDVDCQYAFTPLCPNELPVQDALSIVAELNAQARFAHYRLGSKDAHSDQAHWVAGPMRPVFSIIEQGANMDKAWPLHAVPGTHGFEWIEGLPRIESYDFFVWKGIELNMHPYGACYHDLTQRLSTGVIEFLSSKHVEAVIVGGLATDYCVKETALQLAKAGFKVILNQSACRGVDPHSTQQAYSDMVAEGIRCVRSAAELSFYDSVQG